MITPWFGDLQSAWSITWSVCVACVNCVLLCTKQILLSRLTSDGINSSPPASLNTDADPASNFGKVSAASTTHLVAMPRELRTSRLLGHGVCIILAGCNVRGQNDLCCTNSRRKQTVTVMCFTVSRAKIISHSNGNNKCIVNPHTAVIEFCIVELLLFSALKSNNVALMCLC